MSSKVPTSLFDVWVEYETYVLATLPPKKAQASLAQTRTALLRYTLPAWQPSFSPKGQRLTKEEIEEGLNRLKRLDKRNVLIYLEVALGTQEKVFDALDVPGNSRRTYRWALKKFLDWVPEQPWVSWTLLSIPKQSASRKRRKKGSALNVRLTTRKIRKHYKLAQEEIPQSLQQEVDEFHEWILSAESSTLRRRYKLSAKGNLEPLLRLLGWLYRVQQVPQDQLSLDTVIEFVPLCTNKHSADIIQQAEQAAIRLRSMVFNYFRWLGTNLDHPETIYRGPRSLQPEIALTNTLLAVTCFQYRHELTQANQGAIPATPIIREIHKLRSGLEELRGQQSNAPSSQQLLDWPEFLDFVERLRQECVPRFMQSTQSRHQGVTSGSQRTTTAIAHSYQRFMFAALLAYLPPQRQPVLQHLKFTLLKDADTTEPSCAADNNSFLYRNEESWFLKIPWQSTKNMNSDIKLPVPNIKYTDNRHFYQYLESWLSHYHYQEGKNKPVELPGLRHCFNPQHSYFFTMKNGQPYTNPMVFSDLLRNPAFRITGKVLSPNLIQDMFVRYLIKTGTSCQEVMNLAKLMDYSPERIEEIRRLETDKERLESEYLPAKIAQDFLEGKDRTQ